LLHLEVIRIQHWGLHCGSSEAESFAIRDDKHFLTRFDNPVLHTDRPIAHRGLRDPTERHHRTEHQQARYHMNALHFHSPSSRYGRTFRNSRP
jgi:hypothetical protein